MSELSVIEMIDATSSQPDLKNLIRDSLGEALIGQGKIPEEVLAVEGMSGKKYRYFINNLIEKLISPNYIEIGSWKGSTLISAIYKNSIQALAIDNWSQFEGPYTEFMQNLAKFLTPETKVSVMYSDFRSVDFSNIPKADVFLFDGPHEYEDQRDGVLLVEKLCKDQCILIVDDWNWENVRRGTFDGLNSINYRCDFHVEIRTTLDGSHPTCYGKDSDWHNGYFFAALTKS